MYEAISNALGWQGLILGFVGGLVMCGYNSYTRNTWVMWVGSILGGFGVASLLAAFWVLVGGA